MYVCIYIYIYTFFFAKSPVFRAETQAICNPPWLKSASINKAAKDKGHKARCGKCQGAPAPVRSRSVGANNLYNN